MARVPYLNESDLDPKDHDLLERGSNLFRALVNNPKSARAFARHGAHTLGRSTLDPRLRELAILQVGYVTRVEYEYAHHVEIGRLNGVTDDDIRAIANETAGRETHLSALDSAVLRAARELTIDVSLQDETFAVLEEALDMESLVDLFLTISYYNGVVRTLAALQIDVEEKYLPYLKEFPLPPA